MKYTADNRIVSIPEGNSFTFSCGPHVDCFNECCRDLNQFLTPYDVMRLKNHLGISSTVFLETWTLRHDGPVTGLPVVTLRPQEEKGRKCPFVTSEGCRVYADRPASCRMYPVARMAGRDQETGKIREAFMLIREPHCLGCKNGQERTVFQWMAEQGLGPYNTANDKVIELIGIKQRYCQGRMPRELSERVYTALYDLDRFKERILENRIFIEPDRLPGLEDEEALLDTAIALAGDWLKNTAHLDDTGKSGDNGTQR